MLIKKVLLFKLHIFRLRYLNTNEFNDLLMDLKMHYFMDIYF